MDNIGNWVYLIILGIIAVSGFFTEKKKKARQASVPKPVEPKNEEAVRPATRPDERKVTPNRYRHAEKPVEAIRAEDYNAIPDDIPILIETEEEPNTPVLDIQDAEEIRRAVIYSEILGRKF